MVERLLDKSKGPTKPPVSKKSQKQMESEELDFLLAQSLAGAGIGEGVRSRRRGTRATNVPDLDNGAEAKIKPRNMKKSTLKPSKFNLKKHKKKSSFDLRYEDFGFNVI